MSKTHLPAVTLAVLAYNQEKTVGYAIESALAQDYEGPLTIVLSDDCSPDGTFRVMQEKAAAYKGPHKIILNRNEQNLYVAGNLFKALSQAPSELQCKIDGDDYAAPERVRLQVEAFLQYPSVMLCLAGIKHIHINDIDKLPEFDKLTWEGRGEVDCYDSSKIHFYAPGCMTMWRACLADYAHQAIGDTRTYCEDTLMAHFACLYGDIAEVKRELIGYVHHGGNLSCYSEAQRCSSVRNYLSYEKERIRREIVSQERFAKCDRLIVDWIRERGGVDEAHEQRASAHLEWYRTMIQKFRVELEYAQRPYFSRLLHWMRYWDASVRCLIPVHVKAFIRCMQWKWRRGTHKS